MYLFKLFKFKIRRFLPLGLGIRNILDKYCVAHGSHCVTAPDIRRLLIAALYAALSVAVYLGVMGSTFCVTFCVKVNL